MGERPLPIEKLTARCERYGGVGGRRCSLFFCAIADAEDGLKKALSYTEYRERKMQEGKMKEYQWVCKVCGYVYDGTVPFEDLPDDYVCPVCGVGKEEFEKVEVKEK